MFNLMATNDHMWRVPPANLLLSSDDVHVWRACLDVTESRLRSLAHIISKDELRKANSFYFKRDREHFIVGRGILRTILGRYLDVEPRRLHFCYNPYGKPTLANTSGKDNLSFNLSHSHGLVLYAITRVREIGIDLERIRPELTDDNIAERFFSHREIAILNGLSGNIRRQTFFNYWSRKEAYIKARGEGLSIPLACFDVSMAPGNPMVLLNPERVPESFPHWYLRDLIVGSNYVAAIAVEGNGWRFSCWQWPEHQSGSCA